MLKYRFLNNSYVSVETIPVQAEKQVLVLCDTAFIHNCLVMSVVQD